MFGFKRQGLKGGRIAIRSLVAALCLLPLASGLRISAQPAGVRPPVLKDVGIDQLLNNQVPLDLEFRDETGRTIKLAEYFKDKPVILSLVYYNCPQLCTQVLTGLLGAMKGLPMTPGKEFVNVTVSFDPRETPEMAAAKKDNYLRRYNRPGSETGWHFLTGGEPAIQALTKAVGFRFVWDPVTKQYAHASGIMVLTPQGKVSRYFYGIEYAPRDLRFGVMDASAGKVGSLADQVILYCYMYDPERGTYGLVMTRVLRIFAALTLVTLVALFFYLRRKEKQKEARWKAQNLMNPSLFLIQIPFMPEQASSFAFEVDLFYLFLISLTTFFTIGIAVTATYFLIRYRRRSQGEIPEQIEGAMKLEITWTVIPFLIAMFIFAWGAKLYYQIYTVPKDALEIFVTGKQWMWRAQHPDGQREINELHVPLGRRVKLTMTSEDVIHSYYIPAFRTKTDLVPGRYTTTWFTPTKTGVFHLFCAEYCGTQHSGMIGKVIVQDYSDYQAWLRGVPRDRSPAEAGEQFFTSLACANCHKDEDGGRGPALAGLFGADVRLSDGSTVKVDEAYIRESILRPGAKIVAGYPNDMPTFQGLVTEEQVAMIIQYIKSLGAGGTRSSAASPAAARPATTAPAPAAKPAKSAAPQGDQPKQN